MIQLTKDESKAITITKVICMLGVIFIHAAIKMYVDCSEGINFYYDFLTRILVSFSVPGFFWCSGFLFFMNYEGLNSYRRKLKSRFRGLGIPYIFWITLTLFVSWLIQDVFGFAKMFGAGNMKLIHDFSYMDVLCSYWNLRDGSPFLSTMWFLRDLMVCMLFAPILFSLLRFGKYSLLFILALVMSSLHGVGFANIAFSSILYFSMGGYISINGINIFAILKSKRYLVFVVAIILLVVYASIYTENVDQRGILYNLVQILFNMAMLLSMLQIGHSICSKPIGEKMMLLSVPSYFIYLAHEPYMGYILQLILKLFSHNSTIYSLVIVLIPILYPIIIIGLFYMIFKIFRKYMPSLLSLAVGGKI